MRFTTTSALVACAAAAPALAAPALKARQSTSFGTLVDEPSSFTSAFSTRAVPGTVIANDGSEAPGQPGAFGHFGYKINVDEDIICFDIRTVNVTGDYQSPAFTATHIHQGPVGSAGPPRIAFPNPEFVRNDSTGAEVRISQGCLQGPFSTNLTNDAGADTGSDSGFTLTQLQENPEEFFTDTHTTLFPAGAVRGQLLRSEVPVERPSTFTSVLRTTADGSQVVNAQNVTVPGPPETRGEYVLEINSDEDILCYDITIYDFPEGEEYFSPAKTATHVHAGVFGVTGPPRLAFKNPEVEEEAALKKRYDDAYWAEKKKCAEEKKKSWWPEYKKEEHKPKYEAPKYEAPKKEEHKPKYEAPKKEEHKPKYEAPKKEEHKPKYEAPKKDDHKPYTPPKKEEKPYTPPKKEEKPYTPPKKDDKPVVPPKGDDKPQIRVRKSSACVKGPFTTGLLNADGVDTGSASGFTLADLEANPTAFNADFHTESFAAGAIRGQLWV